MRKLLFALLALILFSMAASARKYKAIYKDGTSIYYECKKGYAYVASSPNGYSGDLSIPGTIADNLNCIEIIDCETGEKVAWLVIKDGEIVYNSEYYGLWGGYPVEGFCENALDGCTNLTSITFPSRRYFDIPGGLFKDCDNLKEIKIGLLNPQDGQLYSPDGSCAVMRRHTSFGDVLVAGCKNTKIPSNAKRIDEKAFLGCKGLKEITIPEGVKTIERKAFAGTGLTKITIPESVKLIEDSAFADCTNLQSVIIYGDKTPKTLFSSPDAGTYFWETAFDGCKKLTSVTVKSGSIRSGSGFSDSALKEVHLEEGVDSIGGFEGCKGLTSITIPNSVKKIYYGAFANTGLTSITIPNSVEKIGDGAFEGCTSLESVIIGGDNITIGRSVFRGCTALTDVTIEEGHKIFLPSIYDVCFYGCTSLRTFTVRGTVSSSSVVFLFYGASIPDIHISDVNVWCNSSIQNWTNLKYRLFLNGEEVNHLKIPEGVTTISDYAFMGCASLKSVTLPNSLISIGTCSFFNCDNLLLVLSPMENPCAFGSDEVLGIDKFYTTNPDDVIGVVDKQVGEYYRMKKHLLTAYVPMGTISVYENTTGWDKFPNILDGIIEAIDPEAVYPGPHHNQSVIFTANSYTIECGDDLPVFGYTSRGGNYNGEPEISCEATKDSPAGTYPIVISRGSVTGVLPTFVNGTLTIIEKSGAQGEDNPDEPIAIIDSRVATICLANWDSDGDGQLSKAEAAAVTSLGTVFQGKTEIASFDELQYFTGLKKIDNDAFYDCTNMESVTLPNSVTEIGEEAFYNCPSLRTINWGTGLKKIGDFAFCNDNDALLSSLTIPDGVEEIGWLAFCSSALTTVTLPTSIKKLSHDAFSCLQQRYIKVNISDLGAFQNVEVLPNNYGDGLCFGSYRLYLNGTEVTSVSVPNNATSVGLIYSGCGSLNSVAFHKDVTEIAENAFSVCPNITKVVAYRETPADISGTMRFDDEVLENATLYVPKGKTTTYYNAGWRFTKIYEINSGDANGNDVIDPNDIELVSGYIMTGEEPNGFRWQNANANGDSEINAADIVNILNLINKP